MNQGALLANWRQEAQRPFSGWDFSYLEGRMFEDQPPWSYPARAGSLMAGIDAVLDLDTGGGERLCDLRPHWPRRVVATESYPPNVRLSHERLQRHGTHVVMAESLERVALPFAAESFDLILNRHGAFGPSEIARVLRAKGTFLTKQVHGMWAYDLLALFGAKPQWPDSTPDRYVPLLQAAGLTIEQVEDWQGELHFSDVGAIVYYLKAVPWLVPGFDVETHQAVLFDLQQHLEEGHPLSFWAGTYLIEAAKP
jgi:SAM-dependent methyltransferase